MHCIAPCAELKQSGGMFAPVGSGSGSGIRVLVDHDHSRLFVVTGVRRRVTGGREGKGAQVEVGKKHDLGS